MRKQNSLSSLMPIHIPFQHDYNSSVMHSMKHKSNGSKEMKKSRVSFRDATSRPGFCV
ncbi:hypothetical protein ACP_0058 [Acidobacterium capsulatum ATCC 51196]|uniref:Uncharacterized protein n=1 Tax=Acidobacterium capsulatum (strain ATCC 51196 / DSM 11244 / BCRC 80197 / JCM 7670 / NBRC 15755 / NCIMB 13165 / 161) TaxID=240015 RepID=C1F814_ACIC5|nr:hypothetical protein ACP_0058 [Acidobacterium capsulatum ATCC 51196]